LKSGISKIYNKEAKKQQGYLDSSDEEHEKKTEVEEPRDLRDYSRPLDQFAKGFPR
jgi:hypothetical protein